MTDGSGWDWRGVAPGSDSTPPIAPPPVAPPLVPPGTASPAPPPPAPSGSPVPPAAAVAPPPGGAESLSPEQLAEVWRTSREPAGKGSGLPRGPRGRGTLIRVGGLLMVLVTIAIMAVLGAKVISGLSSDDGTATTVGQALVTTSVPGAGAAPSPRDAAACEIERRTIETAAQAYVAITGSAPADLQALLDERLLVPDDELANFEIIIEGDQAVVRGVGPCAGA